MCVIILLYSLTSYTIYADWLSYSYARDIVKTIKSSIKPEDKILIDRGGYEYRYIGNHIAYLVLSLLTMAIR